MKRTSEIRINLAKHFASTPFPEPDAGRKRGRWLFLRSAEPEGNRRISKILFFFIVLFPSSLFTEPLSFSSIPELTTPACGKVRYLTASDGVRLAYREYIPEFYSTSLLFIHGGGAHSCAGYQYLAQRFKKKGIAVFTLDLRGHGLSESFRGYTPSQELLYEDFNRFAEMISSSPEKKLVFAGHSSGAGFLLNYSGYKNSKRPDLYLFLAPEFGFRANTARKTETPFAEPRLSVFIASVLSGGMFLGKAEAVKFHYPDRILKKDPLLLRSITARMASGLTPDAPSEQLARLSAPTRILIGAEDEIIDPAKLKQFVETANRRISVHVIPKESHLSILKRTEEMSRLVESYDSKK